MDARRCRRRSTSSSGSRRSDVRAFVHPVAQMKAAAERRRARARRAAQRPGVIWRERRATSGYRPTAPGTDVAWNRDTRNAWPKQLGSRSPRRGDRGCRRTASASADIRPRDDDTRTTPQQTKRLRSGSTARPSVQCGRGRDDPAKLDARALRADFPIFEQQIHGKPLAFLDSAASSQKPRQVLDAMTHFYETSYANVHRGVYELAERATEALEHARGAVPRVRQRAVGARDHLHRATRPRRSTSSPTRGGSTTSAPATSSSSPSSSTTRTSSRGSTSRSKTGAEFRMIPVDDRRRARPRPCSTRSRGDGNVKVVADEPRLELARHDQPGREARRVGARARRDQRRRRRAGRAAPAHRRAGARRRLRRDLAATRCCGPSGVGVALGHARAARRRWSRS